MVRRFSSDSVEIFWLDRAAAKANVVEAAGRLAEAHPEIERVVLFGSLARGDAAPGSDADLLVVLSRSNLPFLERLTHYRLDDTGMAADLFPYTREELEAALAISPSWRAALAEGVVIFDRQAPPARTSGSHEGEPACLEPGDGGG